MPFAPQSPSSSIILYKWCKIIKVKTHAQPWDFLAPRSLTPRLSLGALTYSTVGAGDCNYCGRFTILLQGCEAFTKGHWSLQDLSPFANLCTSCMRGMKCVYCMKTKQVSVNILLPFVFIASRCCNVLSVSFPFHHNAPSFVSSPNSAPRWLMVWLLMFPLIQGITHRGIILSVLIFIISLTRSPLFPFSFCLSQSPLTHPSLSHTQTPISAALVPVLCTP